MGIWQKRLGKKLAQPHQSQPNHCNVLDQINHPEVDRVTIHIISKNPPQTLTVASLHFTAIDLGGHEQVRRVWKDYFHGIDAVVFVVDAADRQGILDISRWLSMGGRGVDRVHQERICCRLTQ